jgi:hypothetical protein
MSTVTQLGKCENSEIRLKVCFEYILRLKRY